MYFSLLFVCGVLISQVDNCTVDYTVHVHVDLYITPLRYSAVEHDNTPVDHSHS